MSKGSRKKRATRPWQDASAMRNIEDLLARENASDEDDDTSRWDDDESDATARRGRADVDDSRGGGRGSSGNGDVRTG